MWLFLLGVVLSAAQQVVVTEKCEACLEIVQAAEVVFENQTDISEILAYLDAQCKNKTTDPQQLEICEAVANLTVHLPEAIFQGEESLAWDIPIGTCALLMQCNVKCCSTKYTPEQIHLSLTGEPGEVGVSWVTLNVTNNSQIQYGPNPSQLEWVATAEHHTYKWGGWLGTIYTAKMVGLKPLATFYYRVGSDSEKDAWSLIYNFSTLANDTSSPLRLLVLGDMDFGPASDNTVQNMIQDTSSGKIDLVIHVGDISYADGYEYHWDVFMNKIQPIASHVPYMVCPGNHEFWFNFTSYKERFYMPGVSSAGGSGDNMYYSWNLNNVHFLSLNSETAVDTAWMDPEEQKWLENDLANVDRKAYPWVIVYFHRPLYCSNTKTSDCENFAALLRHDVEATFLKYGVDLVITGHLHDYERTYPVYNNTLISTSYTNPQAPVYIINGAGGNREGQDHSYRNPLPTWSAFRSGDVGYGHLVVDGNSLQWNFFSASATGLNLEDSMEITKTLSSI